MENLYPPLLPGIVNVREFLEEYKNRLSTQVIDYDDKEALKEEINMDLDELEASIDVSFNLNGLNK